VIKKFFTVILFTVFTNSFIFASGFQINEHGARAMSMANAFTGLANDPSAIHFNPAGITQLRGTQFLFGATLIGMNTTFRGPSPEITEYKLKSQLFTPFNFYVTQQITDKLYAGLGVNNPYGLGTKWDEDWVGRFLSTEVEIRTFNFSPVIAYKLLPNLSLSAGFTYSYADVLIAKHLIPNFGVDPANEAKIEMKGDGNGYGYSAGILYSPVYSLSLGASFRSKIKYDFEGTSKSSGPSQIAASLPNGNITAPLTVPYNLNFGVAFKGVENLVLTADIQYVGWESYDTLKVNFENSRFNSANPREYNNSYILRFGTEYKGINKLALRGGIFFDKNPVPTERLDPTLPDADRIGLNIGFGYKILDKLGIDVSYLFLRFSEREVNNSKEDFNGVYNSTANLFGLNLSFTF